MSFSIANNVSSLNARNNLQRSQRALGQSVERLSSGFQVNRGADGPAALVISEKQRAQISGLRQAIENSDKAVSLVQTAEGALGEINSLLVRVRSLALDSANAGFNDDDSLAANQAEIANALDTIDRIAANTQFGDRNILDGSAGIAGTANDTDVTVLSGGQAASGSFAIEVTTAGERANVTAGTAQTGPLAADEVLTVNDVSITLATGLTQAQVVARINEFSSQTGVVADIDSGATRLRSEAFGANADISAVSNVAAAATSSGIGTTQLTDDGVDVVGTIDGLAATGVGNTLTAADGAARGLTVAIGEDAAALTSTATGTQGDVNVVNNSLIFQIGANQNQTASIAVNSVTSSALGLGEVGNQFTSLADIQVTSASGAQDAIGIIDSAINDITTLRGDLGAFQQNTLTSTANNLRTTLENTINAESVIRDTDFAEEISNFTNQQVLVQAGTSVLGNANQLTQGILSLLQ